MKWTDRWHYSTPKTRFIVAKLPNGDERPVRWNNLAQSWEDGENKACSNWVEWREIGDA